MLTDNQQTLNEYAALLPERVKAGAIFLDSKLPDWWQKIQTQTLDMQHNCNCVLGQLYGSYHGAVAKEFPLPDGKSYDDFSYDDRHRRATELGFQLPEHVWSAIYFDRISPEILRQFLGTWEMLWSQEIHIRYVATLTHHQE